jgi:glycosyltransferase involved in cell wall biosynthesis
MHVVQVSHLYRPSLGGIENYAHRLVGSLRDRGHVASVVTTDASLRNGRSPLPAEADVDYCRTDVVPFRNPLSRELYRRLRDGDVGGDGTEPDVYHLHSLWYLTSLAAVRALPSDAPVVMTLHGFQPIGGPAGRLLEAAWRPFARSILRRVDRTIVLGESERRRLVAEYGADPDRVVVVPNGIDPDEHVVDPAAVDAFRAAHDLDPDVPTVLFVGRLYPLKRPDRLVEAVVDRLPGVDCQVVVIGHGEGRYADAVRERAAGDDRFRFLSNLPFEELLAAYEAADCLVCLSAAEGLPTVVLEAMNAGLPVVTTPAGALADVIADGVNGRLLEPDPTPAAVAAALGDLLADDAGRRTMGERNRAYLRESFAWESVADCIVDVYADVLADRAAEPAGAAGVGGGSVDADADADEDRSPSLPAA